MARAAFLAALLVAQPAFAEDWSASLDARHAADWSGAYVGAFGGMGISSGRAALHDFSGVLLPLDVQYGLFPQGISRNKVGGAVGVAAGVNVQTGAFVGGIEGDIGYTWTRAHHAYSRIDNVPGSPFPGVSTDTRYSTDFGAVGTLRLRGGYAFDNTLVYATAGAAAGHVRNRFELALPDALPGWSYRSPDWSASGLRVGYALGVGVEHKMTDNVSLKLETMYINLSDRVVRGTDPAAFPGESISYRFSNDIVTPRLGLSVKF